MEIGSCNGRIRVPLAVLSGWGMACGFLWAGGGSLGGDGFSLHGFSLHFSVLKCPLYWSYVV